LIFFAAFIQPSFSQKREQRPNILFCIADDASFDHFSAYGSKWVKTPNFDRIASSGLLFMNAFTNNAKCGPSRASVLTGRNSWQLEALGNHLAYWPAKYQSVMELIGSNGYKIGFTGKGWAPGIAMLDGKLREVTGKAYQQRKLKASTRGISSIDYAANFDDFLNDRD